VFYVWSFWRLNTFGETVNTPDNVVLDLRMTGWNLREAYEYFDKCGPNGRDIGKRVITEGYDIIYPIFYTLFWSLLLSVIQNYSNSTSLINIIPLATFLFDMLENYCIYKLMILYPQKEEADMWATGGSLFTILKWASLWLILISLILLVASQFFVKKKNQ